MSIRDEAKRIYNLGLRFAGMAMGDTWSVYRPDYTTGSANVERLIARKMFRAEPLGPKFAEPGLPDTDYYSIFGDLTGLQKGDVFIDPTGTAAPLTLLNFYHMKEATAFRTSRKCDIYDDIRDPAVMVNVRYEWLKHGSPAAGLSDILTVQDGVPARKVVLYAPDKLLPQNYHIQGKKLVESDGTLSPPRRWHVHLAEYLDPLIVLTLREES